MLAPATRLVQRQQLSRRPEQPMPSSTKFLPPPHRSSSTSAILSRIFSLTDEPAERKSTADVGVQTDIKLLVGYVASFARLSAPMAEYNGEHGPVVIINRTPERRSRSVFANALL